jgi:hypothetical protein
MIIRTIDSSISEKAEHLLFLLFFIPYFMVFTILLSPGLVVGE